MNRIFRRAAMAAGSLGVVGGIVLTALPASAAGPIAAWGASATGPIAFPPIALATPFHTPGVASNANFTNVLTTGLIIDRASDSTAYSLVNSPLVKSDVILASFRADQVTSWCHAFGGPFTAGGASIYNGSVMQNGSTVYNPLTNPAPNTVVHIFGATIIFTRQTVVAGHRTVAAVWINRGPEIIQLGVSTC
jgi:hypothetical protein